MFEDYLGQIDKSEADCLKEYVIGVVLEVVPDSAEGLSYGFPAFKFRGKSLVGFSSNKYGLNIYPFDPRIVSRVIDDFPDLDHSKGVIRFTKDNPIPSAAAELMVQLRYEHLIRKYFS